MQEVLLKVSGPLQTIFLERRLHNILFYSKNDLTLY